MNFHRREQLDGQVSVRREARAKPQEDQRVELQMSLELGFAAIRVNLRDLTADILMDILTLRKGYRWDCIFGIKNGTDFTILQAVINMSTESQALILTLLVIDFSMSPRSLLMMKWF